MNEPRRKVAAALQNRQVSIDGNHYTAEAERRINGLFRATFTSTAGAEVLKYLEGITVRRVIPPDRTPQELAYQEGARWLFGIIKTRINEAGNGNS